MPWEKNLRNFPGKKFGRLIVKKFFGLDKKGQRIWLCACECGKKKTVTTASLNAGVVRSCGCLFMDMLKKKNFKHGKTHSRIYNIYNAMMDRCQRKSSASYHRYGGRGISVCASWKKDFRNFYSWSIKSGYQDHLSIDRIDNNGNYTPSNCRWATQSEQARNTNRNHFVIIDGEKMVVSDASKKFNINRKTATFRMKKGWSAKKSFTYPVKNSGGSHAPV